MAKRNRSNSVPSISTNSKIQRKNMEYDDLSKSIYREMKSLKSKSTSLVTDIGNSEKKIDLMLKQHENNNRLAIEENKKLKENLLKTEQDLARTKTRNIELEKEVEKWKKKYEHCLGLVDNFYEKLKRDLQEDN